jgi:hypothetical protein
MLIEGLPPRSSKTCIKRGESAIKKCCSAAEQKRVWRSGHRKTGTDAVTAMAVLAADDIMASFKRNATLVSAPTDHKLLREAQDRMGHLGPKALAMSTIA